MTICIAQEPPENRPDFIADKTMMMIDSFLERWPYAAYGPAHIVLDDLNLDDADIKWCKGLINGTVSRLKEHFVYGDEDQKTAERCDWWRDHPNDELIATADFLDELLAIPEDDR